MTKRPRATHIGDAARQPVEKLSLHHVSAFPEPDVRMACLLKARDVFYHDDNIRDIRSGYLSNGFHLKQRHNRDNRGEYSR